MFEFLVQLVEHDVAQQRTQWTTLRRALLAHLKDSFVHYAASKVFVYQTHHPTVLYRAAEDFYELAMAHRVEEAFQVEVNHIDVAGINYLLRSTKCVMASSSRTETVAPRGELALINGSQGLVDGLLHHAVNYRGDAQQAHLAIVLGYLYPFHWGRTVRAVLQGMYQSILVSQEPREHLLT